MPENNRKDRILDLITRKVFASLNAKEAKELEELISHPDEDKLAWEQLYIRDNLINFITRKGSDGSFDVEAAKEKFFRLIVQLDKKK